VYTKAVLAWQEVGEKLGNKQIIFQIPRHEIKGKAKHYWISPKLEIIVWRKGEQYFAFQSICPHMGGQLRYDESREKLACPWHPLTFDVETGDSDHCRYKSVTRYDTEVRGNELLILDRKNREADI
jgi:nitrite reductase/ring-hydroxylating ferredoxin subunit